MNKRLNEQFEKTKKNVLNETTADVAQMQSTIKVQNDELDQLRNSIDKLQNIESAYNSDKKMFYKTIQELTDEIDSFKASTETNAKAKQDYEEL